MKSISVLCLTLISVPVMATCTHDIQIMTPDAIESRLKPQHRGDVHLTAAVSGADVQRTPEEIYNQHCVVCHAAGVAGAPKLGDEAAWAPRVTQGMDVLLKHVVEGYKMMPAMGTCNSCTEADIQATIEYMLAY